MIWFLTACYIATFICSIVMRLLDDDDNNSSPKVDILDLICSSSKQGGQKVTTSYKPIGKAGP